MAGVWYYTQNGQQMGPVSDDDLRRLAGSGALKPTELVWKEGMANWTSAASVRGLFPQRTPAATGSVAAAPDVYHAAPPASERRTPPPDEEEDLAPRPRRKRKKGSNIGLIIGLVGGGVALVFLLVVGGVAAVLLFASASYTAEGTRSWNLAENQDVTFPIYFKAGHKVEIEVKSTGRSDVDLFVYDGDQLIVQDDGPSSNCFVSFVPSVSKTYQVKVWNRHVIGGPPGVVQNGPNSGTLHYRQIELGKGGGPLPNNPPPADPKGNIPPAGGASDLDINGALPFNQQLTYNVVLKANTTYTIDLHSNAFDAFLELHDPGGVLLADNDDAGPGTLDSRIIFTPQREGAYRVIARALGNRGGGPFHLTVRH